jgi:hypothetical protein
MPDLDADYTVRAYWLEQGAPGKWPHYVTTCETLGRALHLAKNVRQIFGCATWIEAFDQPASVPLLRVRQTIALMWPASVAPVVPEAARGTEIAAARSQHPIGVDGGDREKPSSAVEERDLLAEA